MKNLIGIIILSLFAILVSCSNDDSPLSNQISNEQAEILENTPLEANQVSNNVVITGGTKKDGVPPIPNEAISLDISDSGKTAFLGEGFEVALSSDAEIVGAYIQFKANDGTVADSYYDVDIVANSSNKKSTTKKALISRKMSANSLAHKINNATLDVDFGSEIPPGEFCYVLCVYDEQGNISAPQEVCVTVESWGGNIDMVGTWKLVKVEEINNGETESTLVGSENCYSESYECNNGGTLEATECNTREYGTVVVNADGTYNAEFKGLDRFVDYTASTLSCEAVYINEVYKDISEGNWAYVEADKRLTIVEYKYSSEINGELEEIVTLEPGDAELVLDGSIVIDGDTFFITESQDYDGDGVIDEVHRYYFEK